MKKMNKENVECIVAISSVILLAYSIMLFAISQM